MPNARYTAVQIGSVIVEFDPVNEEIRCENCTSNQIADLLRAIRALEYILGADRPMTF